MSDTNQGITKRGKEARAAYLRAWRAANKDRQRANAARYWNRKAQKQAEQAKDSDTHEENKN